jgi:hypothetical protein
MYRAIAFAAAALCLAQPAFAKKAAQSEAPPTRIEIAPGVTIAVPQGWQACDKATTAALGAKPLASGQQFSCGIAKAGVARIQLLRPGTNAALGLMADYLPYAYFSAEVLASPLPPEILQELKDDTCSISDMFGTNRNEDIVSCSVVPVSVAGNGALLGTISLRESGQGAATHVLRIYHVPYPRGYLLLQIEAPIAIGPRDQSVLDAMLASVQIETTAPLPPESVQLSPAPGVTLSVPKGWVACETEAQALLGGPPLPPASRDTSCKPAAEMWKLRTFNPQLLRNMSAAVGYKSEADISQHDVERLSGSRMEEVSRQHCEEQTQEIASGGETVEGCSLALGTLAGRKALVSTMTIAPKDGSASKRVYQTAYYLPYERGYLVLVMVVPMLGMTACLPVQEAIVQSIAIQ